MEWAGSDKFGVPSSSSMPGFACVSVKIGIIRATHVGNANRFGIDGAADRATDLPNLKTPTEDTLREMAKTETASTRLPRGTKPVAQAFFSALDSVPDAQRAAVLKAAQGMIRDELKARKDKAKATSAKAKAPPAKRGPRPGPKKAVKAEAASHKPGRRGRRPASAGATA